MKLAEYLTAAVLLGVTGAQGALVTYQWTSGFANTGSIPDNDPSGWQDTRSITSFGGGGEWQITDLNVTLHLSGGYNGDLYGYLVHDSGFVVLLNRIGVTTGNPVGYLNPGMNVTFDDAASTDIHSHGTLPGVVTGAWQPDGRTTHPTVVLATDPRTTALAAFNGLDPNGLWTLAMQDLSFGGSSQVVSWGLEITAVPEPATLALGVFGALAVGGVTTRRLTRRLSASSTRQIISTPSQPPEREPDSPNQ